MLVEHLASPMRTRAQPDRTVHMSRSAEVALTGIAPLAVLVLALAVLCGEIGALIGWRFLTSTIESRVALGAVVVVAVGALSLGARGGRGHVGGSGRGLWLASGPGLLLFVYAAASLFLPLARRAEWFLGGDHVRHLVFTVQEAVTGYLDYGVNSYPRAWHTLVAMAWSSLGSRQDADGLLSLVSLMSLGTWCLYAVFSLATGLAAHALAVRCRFHRATAARAGLFAGALTLWPSFFSDYQVLGFENSIVAAMVVAVCAREILTGPARLRAVIVCAAAVAVMANTWQLLLPAPLIAMIVAIIATARCGGTRTRLVVASTTILAAITSAPGVASVVSQVGIDHATDAGVVAPLPVVLLPLALLGTASVAVHWRRDVRILVVSGMVLVTAASAPALAAAVGIPVTLYYPSKLLWSAGALGLLPLATMTARGVDLLWRLGGAARLAVRSVIVAVSGLLLSLCAVNPASAVFFWDTVDGTRVLKTLTAPNAGTAQVVWLPGELSESTITRILLDFYRVGHHDGYLPQQPLDAEQECGVLRQFVRPAVLSSAPPAVVLARYECVPDLRVVPAVNEARR